MNTASRYAHLGLLLLPLSIQAETLPPPGGPYPSTVTVDQSVEQSHPEDEQLRFPPPDLIAPAPPPPSLTEELGSDFGRDSSQPSAAAGNTANTGQGGGYTGDSGFVSPGNPSGGLPPLPGAYPQPPSTGTPSYPSSSAGQGQGWSGYPAPANPPSSAWSRPPAGNYPGYSYPGYGGWSGYPNYGYSTPSYGYGYPGSGYAPNSNWGDTMQTPFGSMPGPWDSMPKSFFPGR